MLRASKKPLTPHQMLQAPAYCRSSVEHSCADCMQVPMGIYFLVGTSQQRNRSDMPNQTYIPVPWQGAEVPSECVLSNLWRGEERSWCSAWGTSWGTAERDKKRFCGQIN